MSGAHVELSRAPPPNPSEKFFIIRGNAEQIDNAQRMISEKIGLATSPMSGGMIYLLYFNFVVLEHAQFQRTRIIKFTTPVNGQNC